MDEGRLGTGLADGWTDPGQHPRTRPCCLINPAEVTEIGQRQIEQDDLGTASKHTRGHLHYFILLYGFLSRFRWYICMYLCMYVCMYVGLYNT